MKKVAALLLLSVLIAVASSASVTKEDPPTPPPIPPPPPCPVQCRLDGVREFPHFQDCNKYFECAHGFLFELSCGEGEIFDVETLRCQTSGKCAVEKSKS